MSTPPSFFNPNDNDNDTPSRLDAAACVYALAVSDANSDGQIDRTEFNRVVLELLAGCRVSDSTTADFDYIFQTAACYCLDYDDDTDGTDDTMIDGTDNNVGLCCTTAPVVLQRAGVYPSEYLFRVCEFLASAVTFTCAASNTGAP